MVKRKVSVKSQHTALSDAAAHMKLSGSNDLSQYVTTRQAAEMLGVVTDHINHLLVGRKLQGVKLGYSWLVFVPSIEKYQEQKSKRGRPSSSSAKI